MRNKQRAPVRAPWTRGALAGLIVAIGVMMLPASAWAVDCSQVVNETEVDSDLDGFTDYQECTQITTIGTSPRTFFSCRSAEGAALPREQCLDPDSKDLFVIVAPAPVGSLLPADFNPFGSNPPVYGITFSGLSALGLIVHPLRPEEAAANRVVTNAVASLPAMRAVSVAESLDSSSAILGNCQWGTPLGLDGCVVYTQRTKNFIASTCGSATIQTPSGAVSDAASVLLAYSTYLFLHETGHSLGGLTGEYNSRFGGYHYKAGSDLVMEQAATYTVKGGKCTFYISPDWNQTLDAPAVKLINP